MQNNETVLTKKEDFIQVVVECYKLYGLSPAMLYLYINSTDFENDLKQFLIKIYEINEIDYQENEDINYQLSNIKLRKKNIQDIIYLSRGYKGEMRKENIIKLNDNDIEITRSVGTLVKLIEKDLSKEPIITKYEQKTKVNLHK